MLDLNLIIIISIIIILIVIVALGLQLFIILKQLKETTDKINKLFDEVNGIMKSLTPVTNEIQPIFKEINSMMIDIKELMFSLREIGEKVNNSMKVGEILSQKIVNSGAIVGEKIHSINRNLSYIKIGISKGIEVFFKDSKTGTDETKLLLEEKSEPKILE